MAAIRLAHFTFGRTADATLHHEAALFSRLRIEMTQGSRAIPILAGRPFSHSYSVCFSTEAAAVAAAGVMVPTCLLV